MRIDHNSQPSERPPFGSASPHTPELSTELFLIPLDEPRYLVYSPLRRAAFVANPSLVNLIADLREGCYRPENDPQGQGLAFLRQLELVDAGAETLPIESHAGAPEPTFVTLLLTTACNMRCSYCYASAGDRPAVNMELAVARRGIDFVSANAARQGEPCFEIAFHGGGEPTVNWRTLTQATEYAQQRAAALDLGVRVTTATNGALSDAQIDWIVEHLDGVSLSCDGLPDAQDTHRPMANGTGSSERVAHCLQRFDQAGFPYGIRMTVTRDRISSLPDSIAYLCARFCPERIQVEPAYPMGRWRSAPSAETQGFIDAFRQAQAVARAHGRELGYSAARLDTLSNHFCSVSQDGFSLAHDGRVTACYEVFSPELPHAETFFYGQPTREGIGYEFDHAVLAGLRRMSVDHKPFCAGCFAKWHCAGDCHHRTMATSEGGEFRGSERCHITRELLKDQILERLQRTGVGFWHEPPPETDDEACCGGI